MQLIILRIQPIKISFLENMHDSQAKQIHFLFIQIYCLKI